MIASNSKQEVEQLFNARELIALTLIGLILIGLGSLPFLFSDWVGGPFSDDQSERPSVQGLITSTSYEEYYAGGFTCDLIVQFRYVVNGVDYVDQQKIHRTATGHCASQKTKWAPSSIATVYYNS